MSQKREKKRRYNQKLQYIAAFQKWLENEPPAWKVLSRRKWKKQRPRMEDFRRDDEC